MDTIDPAQRIKVYYRVRRSGMSRTYFVNAETNKPCWTVVNEEASTVECPDGFVPPGPPDLVIANTRARKIERNERTIVRGMCMCGIQQSDGESVPVFLDGDLCCYDKFYRLITRINRSVTENSPTYIPASEIPVAFGKGKSITIQVPYFMNFESFDDFKNAFVSWRWLISKAAWPEQVFMFDEMPGLPYVFVGKQEKLLKQHGAPFSLLKNEELVKLIFGEDPKPPPEVKPVGRRRMPVKVEKPKEKNFNAPMQPLEPMPYFYDTYHDFSYAYRNWAILVRDKIENIPMGPQALAKVCQLEKVPQDDGTAEQEVLQRGERDSRHIASTFLWALPLKVTKVRAQSVLSKLWLEVKDAKVRPNIGYVSTNLNGTVVCGVDKDEFERDFQLRGCHMASLNSGKVLRPITFFHLYPHRDTPTSLKIIARIQSAPVERIYKILKQRFDRKQLLETRVSTDPEVPFLDKVSELFCQSVGDPRFIRLLKGEDMNLMQKVRLSVLLHALFEKDRENRFLSVILKPENDEILFWIVRMLMLTIDPRYYVIDAKFDSPSLIVIQQFYLVSIVVDIFLKVEHHCGMVPALRSLQRLSKACPDVLKNKRILDSSEFRRDVLQGEDDHSKLLFMCIQLPSQMCHKLFFRDDDFSWFTPDRRLYTSFLCALTHSPAIPVLAQSITSKNIIDLFLARPKPPVQLLLCLLQYLTSEWEFFWFDPEFFTHLFKTIVSERKTRVAAVLPILGALIEKMYRPQSFQSDPDMSPLRAVGTESCLSFQTYAEGDLNKDPIFYTYLLRGFVALSGCTKDLGKIATLVLAPVAASTAFSKLIADALLASDVNIMKSGWDIVTGIMKVCKYKDMFFKKPEVMNNMRNVFLDPQPLLPLYFCLQFLRNCLKIFAMEPKMAALMDPLNGWLASMLAHRGKKYGDRPMILALLEAIWADVNALDGNVEIKRLIFRHINGDVPVVRTATRFRSDSNR